MPSSMGGRAPTRLYVGPHMIIVMWIWGSEDMEMPHRIILLFVRDMISSFVRNVLIFNKSFFLFLCFLQGLQMGIALPQFLLNIDGASEGILLLGIVGVCIILPLTVSVIYLSRSSKYTGNYVMHSTLAAYYHLMKPSLAPRYVRKIVYFAFYLRTYTFKFVDSFIILKITFSR